MKIIVISGANGFIGSELVKHFNENGWIVRALIHSNANPPIAGIAYYKYALGDKIDERIFEKADCFIHCAYAKDSYKLNVSGTGQLLEMSKKCGIRKNIFQ